MRNWFIKFCIFFICIFSFIIYSSKDVFASCIALVTLAEYKESADIVVLGTVSHFDGTYAYLSVDRYFKGHGGPSELKVTGKLSQNPSQVSSVDFEFKEESKYLLFLSSNNNTLRTNDCAGSKEVQGQGDLSKEDLGVLGTGYVPRINNQDLSQGSNLNMARKEPDNLGKYLFRLLRYPDVQTIVTASFVLLLLTTLLMKAGKLRLYKKVYLTVFTLAVLISLASVVVQQKNFCGTEACLYTGWPHYLYINSVDKPKSIIELLLGSITSRPWYLLSNILFYSSTLLFLWTLLKTTMNLRLSAGK